MSRSYAQTRMPRRNVPNLFLEKYNIKRGTKYALVDQVAKSPFEVLANRNSHLTDLVLKHDIAESLITVIRGVQEYATFFKQDFELVELVEIEPVNRGIVIQYGQKEKRGPDVAFKEGTIDFIASHNERAARWCMEPSNMESLFRYVFAMHFLARTNGLDITDIGCEDARWLNGRDDILFLGF